MRLQDLLEDLDLTSKGLEDVIRNYLVSKRLSQKLTVNLQTELLPWLADQGYPQDRDAIVELLQGPDFQEMISGVSKEGQNWRVTIKPQGVDVDKESGGEKAKPAKDKVSDMASSQIGKLMGGKK